MKIPFLAILCFATIFSQHYSDEGHPIWWWDIKGNDFIVRGKLSFDVNKYIQIIPVNYKEIGKDHYYICGKILIEDILFANSQNQFRDNYNYYYRNIGKQIDVLIPARRVMKYYEGPLKKPHGLELEPAPNNEGVELTQMARIFSLDVIYMFPIGGLVVKSAVPPGKESVVKNLIAKRTNSIDKAKLIKAPNK